MTNLTEGRFTGKMYEKQMSKWNWVWESELHVMNQRVDFSYVADFK